MSQPYKLPSDAVWFITGCSSGLGKAIAQEVASRGSDRLVATARNPSTLSYLPDSSPGKILKLPLDVTSQSSITQAFATALQTFGRVDVVVNNAGYALVGDAENASDAAARKLMDTNFWGVVNITQRAVAVMRDVNPSPVKGGLIMNVTSMGGRLAVPSHAFYHASKWAVEGFTEAISKEVRPEWNVHFALIEPGGVRTNYTGGSMQFIERHPAYEAEDTPARVVERYLRDPEAEKSWAEAGDLARVIYEVAACNRDGEERGKGVKEIPLRIPLGADAWATLKAEHERQGRLLDEAKQVALSVSKKGRDISELSFL